MEFSELIQRRLTTLKYTNKKVSNEEINQIIDSAIMAPSAKNRQPWRFYILSDEQKNYIADKMEAWINHTDLVTTIKRSANLIRNVGNCILIYSNQWDAKHIERIEENKKLLNGEDIENMVVMHDYYFDRIKADILSCRSSSREYDIKSNRVRD